MSTVRLQLFENVCAKCGEKFETLHLPPSTYGVVLFGSVSGQVAFLITEQNAVWEQISSLFEQKNEVLTGVPRERAFDAALEATVDPSTENDKFFIWNRIPCKACGSFDRSFWGPQIPTEFVDVSFVRVSHNHWNALSEAAKRDLTERAVESL